MKTQFIATSLSRVTLLSALFLLPGVIDAQGWRLVGVTGQQGDPTPDGQGGFLYPDHTLYEINLSSGAITKLFRMTFVNDSQSIAYCPADGLLYHSAGSESYSNNPFRNGNDNGGPPISGVGYQDSQYLESVNLATNVATAVFNAAPCPNPDPVLPCFGLPGPRPGWLLPVEQRNSNQTDDSFKARGPNEYHAVRGMAWSVSESLFYLTDEFGIFKLNREGDCTFLARPLFPSDSSGDRCKGIAFVKVGDVIKLFVGHRDGFGSNGLLIEIDPPSGDVNAEVLLTFPPGGAPPVDSFGGLLGIAQHPVTNVLYGIRKTGDNFGRELVTINPVTGATALVGNMEMHIASITFVPVTVPPAFNITSVSRIGNSLTLTWSGGTAPYQVQTNSGLNAASWSNAGPPTNGNSATVTLPGARTFVRVTGQ